MKRTQHFIAMAGLKGYMPMFQTWSYSRDEVIEAALFAHDTIEHGRPRVKSRLKREWYADLDLYKYGNEYIEIQECDCDRPQDHWDS